MKKKITFILALLISMILSSGCSNKKNNTSSTSIATSVTSSVPLQYFDCTIKFSKKLDVNSTDLYLTNELPINTDIHVIVDFTFYNFDSVNDVIDFKVNLRPGFDTYSVHDFSEGPLEPTIPDHECDIILGEGGLQKVIEISGMKFNIKKDIQKKHYYYIFTIRASKTNEDCEFKVLFSPQDGRFNDGRNKSFSKKFSLVNNAEEVE